MAKNVVYSAVFSCSTTNTGGYSVDLSMLRRGTASRVTVVAGTVDAISVEITEVQAAEVSIPLPAAKRLLTANPQSGAVSVEIPYRPLLLVISPTPVYIGTDYNEAVGTVVLEVYE